jgi:hypothetical protein
MKKAFLKTAFVAIVLVLMIVLLIPASLLLDSVLSIGHDAHGRLRSIDRLLPGILVIFACLMAANRIASFLFLSARLTDERWSIFEDRRRRRLG